MDDIVKLYIGIAICIMIGASVYAISDAYVGKSKYEALTACYSNNGSNCEYIISNKKEGK